MKMALIGLLFFVTGCFLNQSEPKPQTQTGGTTLTGVVALEDISGMAEEASFYAVFGKKPAVKQMARHRSYQVASAFDSRPAAPQCEFAVKGKAESLAANAIEAVSVGKVAFGVALQSKMIEAEKDDKHQYAKKLDPGIAAGLYQVVADGFEGVQKLGDVLSMPEEIKLAKGNDQAFESGIVVTREAKFSLTWQAPAIASDANYLIADIIGETETEKFQLHCIGKESDLAQPGTWEIPVEEISKLKLSETAAVFFVRAHVRLPRDPQWDVQLQGIRTTVAAAAIR